MEVTIRPMTMADADAKGRVHYQSWQETYTGLMDPDFLAHMTPEKCQRIAHNHPQNTFVAELDGEIVGFTCPNPDRAEVQAIYLLKKAQGLGIGKKLMSTALAQLSTFPAVTLWVLEGNTQAIGFYEHCGFRYEGVHQNLPGSPHQELQMVLHRPHVASVTQRTHTRFLNFYEFEAVHRDGTASPYYVASRAKDPTTLKVLTHENHPDGVVLYGVYGEHKDRVVLIRQYRYPLGGYVYEFPAGLVEPGEDMLSAATREMYEETGLTFTPVDAGPYSRPFFTTIGMTDESCGTIFGYCTGTPTNRHQEASEDIQVILADRAECRRILKEENVAIMCAYMLMHFIASEDDPMRFLENA